MLKRWGARIDARLDAWGAALGAREVRIPTELVGGVLFFLFALVMLAVMPQQVAVSEKDVINGRAFPKLLLTVMMICCAVLVAKEVYKLLRKQPISWKTVNLLVEVKALIILGILLAMYLICRVSGSFLVGALFCCLAFLLFFRCRKPLYYVITLAMAVAIWAAFYYVLDVRF